MSAINAYPLQWPTGWKRTASAAQKQARFRKASPGTSNGWRTQRDLTIAAAFGWASSNAADTHLKALEKKGYLARNELHHLMLSDRPSEATPAQAAHHLIGQVLVLAGLLEASLCVVRTIEAEDCDECEHLSKLITRGDAAIAQVLKEHAMASTWCAGLTRSTSLDRSGVPA